MSIDYKNILTFIIELKSNFVNPSFEGWRSPYSLTKVNAFSNAITNRKQKDFFDMIWKRPKLWLVRCKPILLSFVFLDKTKFQFLWHNWMPHSRTSHYKATTKLSVLRQQDPVDLVPKGKGKLNLIELELCCYHSKNSKSQSMHADLWKTFSYLNSLCFPLRFRV